MHTQQHYPEQYLEHEGELYYYLKGHFYKKNRRNGDMKNVFDRLLIIDLTGKLLEYPPAALLPGTTANAFLNVNHVINELGDKIQKSIQSDFKKIKHLIK